MHDILLHIEHSSDDVPFIQYLIRRNLVNMSSDEFLNEVKKVSAMLLNENLQKKHIGIIGRNSAEWLIVFCAIANIGSTAVLMNPDLNEREIERAMKQTDVSALFFDIDLEARIKEATKDMNDPIFCIQEKLNQKDYITIQSSDADLEDIMCILYTSGTTGEEKAVMLSNRAVIAGIHHYLTTVLKETAVHLTVMPLHHAGALFTSLAILFKDNCTLGIIDGPMKLKRGLEQIKPNSLFAVPSLLQAIEHEFNKKKENVSSSAMGESLRWIVCGGAQLPTDLIPTFRKKQIAVFNIYGATESTVGVIIHEATKESPNSLGKPQNAEVKIENGELLLRGRTIMTGYYKNPEATEEALKDGWYHTGDLAAVDENGYYYLTGRKKNLIILSNGENISPEELEGNLSLSPDISEVIVKEHQDKLWAVIWPNYQDECTEKEKSIIRQRIHNFVSEYNDQMPTYKQVYDLYFWQSPLPKSATGKIVRNQIRI